MTAEKNDTTIVHKAAMPSGMGLFEFTSLISDAARVSITASGHAPSGEDYPGYPVEIYEDSLIFCVYSTSEKPRSHYRASWKMDDGKVEIGEWREVIEVTNYVEVRKARWQSPSIFDSLFR